MLKHVVVEVGGWIDEDLVKVERVLHHQRVLVPHNNGPVIRRRHKKPVHDTNIIILILLIEITVMVVNQGSGDI